MAAVMVLATCNALTSALTPSPDQIERRMTAAGRTLGRWAGPLRITRTGDLTAPSTVSVSGLFLFAPVATPPDLRAPLMGADTPADRLRRAVDRELGELVSLIPGVSWAPARVAPYQPARNGDLDWWTSGEAARTNTREPLAPGAGLTAPRDTPDGPTTPETRPPNTTDPLGSLRDALPWVVALGALYLVATSRRR
jgi:hypothetical protein